MQLFYAFMQLIMNNLLTRKLQLNTYNIYLMGHSSFRFRIKFGYLDAIK